MSRLLYVVIFLNFFVGWARLTDPNMGERWAVLVAGTQGWHNYMDQANVCHAYKILRKGGLKEENIIVFMYDDIAYNKKNPKQGKIYNTRYGNDVYQGIPKDYTGEHVTSENFYNVLRGFRNGNIGNRKVLESRPTDHIFIYFTTHGEKHALEMPRKGDKVTRDDFLSVLKYMHHGGLYKQMVVYVEACKSGSMFEGASELVDMNIFITTSANALESSYSTFPMKKWYTYLSTQYSAAWMQDSETHNLRKRTLNEQYEKVKKVLAKATKSSHVMKYGSERMGEKYLSEFFKSA